MINFILVCVIVLIVGSAAAYIIKAKKSGKKCIGCPESGSCSSGGCAGCTCHCSESDKNRNK